MASTLIKWMRGILEFIFPIIMVQIQPSSSALFLRCLNSLIILVLHGIINNHCPNGLTSSTNVAAS
jgi:hypothetical protein